MTAAFRIQQDGTDDRRGFPDDQVSGAGKIYDYQLVPEQSDRKTHAIGAVVTALSRPALAARPQRVATAPPHS